VRLPLLLLAVNAAALAACWKLRDVSEWSDSPCKAAIILLSLSVPTVLTFTAYKKDALAGRVVRALGQVCPNCAHDLRGLASAVCPECGARFTARQRMVIWAFSLPVARKLDRERHQHRLGPWLTLRARARGLLRVSAPRVRRRRLLQRTAWVIFSLAIAVAVMTAPRVADAIVRADTTERGLWLLVAAFLAVVVAGYLDLLVYRERRLDAAARRHVADRPLRCGAPRNGR